MIRKYQIKIIDFDRSYMKSPFKEVDFIKNTKKRKIIQEYIKNMSIYTYAIEAYYISPLFKDDLQNLPRRDLERLHFNITIGEGEEEETGYGIHGFFKERDSYFLLKTFFDHPIFKEMKNKKMQKKPYFYLSLLKDSFFDDLRKKPKRGKKTIKYKYEPFNEKTIKKFPNMGLSTTHLCKASPAGGA